MYLKKKGNTQKKLGKIRKTSKNNKSRKVKNFRKGKSRKVKNFRKSKSKKFFGGSVAENTLGNWRKAREDRKAENFERRNPKRQLSEIKKGPIGSYATTLDGIAAIAERRRLAEEAAAAEEARREAEIEARREADMAAAARAHEQERRVLREEWKTRTGKKNANYNAAVAAHTEVVREKEKYRVYLERVKQRFIERRMAKAEGRAGAAEGGGAGAAEGGAAAGDPLQEILTDLLDSGLNVLPPKEMATVFLCASLDTLTEMTYECEKQSLGVRGAAAGTAAADADAALPDWEKRFLAEREDRSSFVVLENGNVVFCPNFKGNKQAELDWRHQYDTNIMSQQNADADTAREIATRTGYNGTTMLMAPGYQKFYKFHSGEDGQVYEFSDRADGGIMSALSNHLVVWDRNNRYRTKRILEDLFGEGLQNDTTFNFDYLAGNGMVMKLLLAEGKEGVGFWRDPHHPRIYEILHELKIFDNMRQDELKRLVLNFMIKAGVTKEGKPLTVFTKLDDEDVAQFCREHTDSREPLLHALSNYIVDTEQFNPDTLSPRVTRWNEGTADQQAERAINWYVECLEPQLVDPAFIHHFSQLKV